MSLEARPLRGLTLTSWVAYNNAELVENFPAALVAQGLIGSKGDQIPNSAQWSAHLSIDQDIALNNTMNGFVGAMASYVMIASVLTP